MKIFCNKCNRFFDLDKYVEGKRVEEYQNIYGTKCRFCGVVIPPVKPPAIRTDNELKIELLRGQMREKMRKKIRSKKCL